MTIYVLNTKGVDSDHLSRAFHKRQQTAPCDSEWTPHCETNLHHQYSKHNMWNYSNHYLKHVNNNICKLWKMTTIKKIDKIFTSKIHSWILHTCQEVRIKSVNLSGKWHTNQTMSVTDKNKMSHEVRRRSSRCCLLNTTHIWLHPV